MRAPGSWRRAVRALAVVSAVMVVALPSISAGADGSTPLLAFGARIAGDDARTRLVIEFDREPDFSIHYVANPFRVIVDLPETSFG
ncbi:MAG TPA: N-acetylmuramoyl-L-alanine amidase, partial [Sinorhizobium sp.]|nr:N-acetylmuramoyl-L-alanine amidase [Sinorhizobium sp.]